MNTDEPGFNENIEDKLTTNENILQSFAGTGI